GHGTNVTSIAAAVAPESRVIGLDVFNTDFFVDDLKLMRALDWAVDHQATYNIVAANLSVGDSSRVQAVSCPTSPYRAVFTSMRAAGILPVVAAGNAATSANGLFQNGLA